MSELERVDALRTAFDRSFEEPLPVREEFARVLVVEAGGEDVALRLEDVRGLFLDASIEPVPTAPPTVLGLVALLGKEWPVYDLGGLLGRPGKISRRVLCLVRGAPGVGVTFERLRSLLAVRPGEISSVTREGAVERLVIDGASTIPLVDLSALVTRELGHTDSERGKNRGAGP